ncbi:MAG: hypothetical protein ACK5PZ_07880, partial [Pirellula sp.]
MANLLGTPSLAPQNRKTDLAGASKTPTAVPNVEPVKAADANVNSGDEIDNAEKPKQEKSRLKSSWDAVASFFGVAAPDSTGSETVQASLSEPTAESQSSKSSASKTPQATRAPAGKKTKPSMWGDEETAEAPVESPKNELPRSAFDTKSRSGRDPEVTDVVITDSFRSPKPSRSAEPESGSDEPSEFGAVSDRRSNRRPPRRGRSRATSEEGTTDDSLSAADAVVEGGVAEETSDRERSDRRGDGPRSGQRGGREARASGRDRSSSDRPPRSDSSRSESSRSDSSRSESSRGEPRGEAAERNDRGSREGSRRPESGRDSNQRDAGGREGNRRDESRRDE